MNRTLLRAVAVCVAAMAFPSFLKAQELVTGLGYSAFNAPTGQNSAVGTLEWAGAPFGRFLGADVSWNVALDVHARGDLYAGAGLRLRWRPEGAWFVDAAIMPGLYDGAGAGNTIGGAFHFRSLLGVGRDISDRSALSLAVHHKSNAKLRNVNPGLDTVQLRWHRRF